MKAKDKAAVSILIIAALLFSQVYGGIDTKEDGPLQGKVELGDKNEQKSSSSEDSKKETVDKPSGSGGSTNTTSTDSPPTNSTDDQKPSKQSKPSGSGLGQDALVVSGVIGGGLVAAAALTVGIGAGLRAFNMHREQEKAAQRKSVSEYNLKGIGIDENQKGETNERQKAWRKRSASKENDWSSDNKDEIKSWMVESVKQIPEIPPYKPPGSNAGKRGERNKTNQPVPPSSGVPQNKPSSVGKQRHQQTANESPGGLPAVQVHHHHHFHGPSQAVLNALANAQSLVTTTSSAPELMTADGNTSPNSIFITHHHAITPRGEAPTPPTPPHPEGTEQKPTKNRHNPQSYVKANQHQPQHPPYHTPPYQTSPYGPPHYHNPPPKNPYHTPHYHTPSPHYHTPSPPYHSPPYQTPNQRYYYPQNPLNQLYHSVNPSHYPQNSVSPPYSHSGATGENRNTRREGIIPSAPFLAPPEHIPKPPEGNSDD